MKYLPYLITIILAQTYQCYGLGQFVHLRNHGILRGDLQFTQGSKVYFFKQIRYAEAGRFELPKEDNTKWSLARRNPVESYICPQPILNPSDPNIVNKIMTEDCLYMNIWAPTTVRVKKLPVIVFIHGGTYMTGSIHQDEFDGAVLAARTGSVVVTMNYRLGALGFLSPNEPEPPIMPNLGLQDQLMGLKFVQDHIKSFGGNPNDVTLMGNSAGSMSIGAFMLSPYVRQLRFFHRAIMASGAPTTLFALNSLQVGEQKSQLFLNLVGCTEPTTMNRCLKSISMEDILRTQTAMIQNLTYFTPVFGDGLLPMSPIELLNNLNLQKRSTLLTNNFTELKINDHISAESENVDLLFGTTLNEGSTIFFQIPGLLEPDALDMTTVGFYIGVIIQFFNLNITPERLLNEYLPGVDQTSSYELGQMLSRIYADVNINCQVLYFSEHYHRADMSRSMYGYLLKQKTVPIYDGCLDELGICHTSEIPYIFGVPLRSSSAYSTPDKILSKDFIDSIREFVHYGMICRISGVEWTQALINNDIHTMDLNAGNYRMSVSPFLDRCRNFWYPILFPSK